MPYNSPHSVICSGPVRPNLSRSNQETQELRAAMPTPNHDSSAVAVNAFDDAAKQRSRRIVGVSLGATLITMVVLFAAMAFAPVDANAANTCTLTSTQPVTNWSDTTKWSGCGGGYPGQSGAGDTAIVSLTGFTLNVDVAAN